MIRILGKGIVEVRKRIGLFPRIERCVPEGRPFVCVLGLDCRHEQDQNKE